MASGLKLVLLILLTTCTSVMNPIRKRFKSKNKTNPTIPSQSTSPTNDITNQTLPSGSGICNLAVDQSLLATISKLTQNSAINIVELQLFVDSESESRLLPDVTWTWTNKVGREIISLLSQNASYIDPEVISTLRVGRIKLDVQIYENPQGCIASEEKETIFVAKHLLEKLFNNSNMEYQLCYGTENRKYTCCKIFSKGQQSECYVHHSHLTTLYNCYLIICQVALVLIVTPLLLSRILGSSQEEKYYKITDSLMSPTSIIYSVFFEGYGPVKSFVRRFIFIGLVLFVRFYFFALPFPSVLYARNFISFVYPLRITSLLYVISNNILIFSVFVIYDVLLVVWALVFQFSGLFEQINILANIERLWSSNKELVRTFTDNFNFLRDYEDVLIADDNYQSIVNVLTLLCNVKRWQRSLKKFFNATVPRGCGKKCCYYIKAVFYSIMCFIVCMYVVVTFVILFMAIAFKILSYAFFPFSFYYNFGPNSNCFQKTYIFCSFLFMLMTYFYFSISLHSIIFLYFAGIILNVVHYIPFLTSISVLVFYSWTFWQDVEIKYFTLKMQIYEVCKEKFDPDCVGGKGRGNVGDGKDGNVNIDKSKVGDGKVGNDDNDDNDDNDLTFWQYVKRKCFTLKMKIYEVYKEIFDPDYVGVADGNDGDHNDDIFTTKWRYNHNNESMISIQLYDRIREEILPYNLTLFHFFIKVFFVFLFALLMFTVINILRTADISGTVKVITTMSVSVVPHILNVVAAKISEERKNAQNEVQKIKVEKLVSKLTESTDQVYQIYMEMSDDEIVVFVSSV